MDRHTDEVDRLLAAWQRERPDVDITPMAVLSRISRLSVHLDRARRVAFATHGLTGWEFDVLSALRRSGAPYRLSPGQLAAENLVTSGTMTNRVDRLLARGLVSRAPDEQDRRGVVVQLTDSGRQTVDAALVELMDHERSFLEVLGPGGGEELASVLRDLTLAFEQD